MMHGIEEVIQVFVKCTGVDRASLFSNKKCTNRVNNARFMLYQILRDKCGESSYSIAKKFRRPRRNIVRGLSIIRDLMKVYKDMKDEYDKIVKEIEDAR